MRRFNRSPLGFASRAALVVCLLSMAGPRQVNAQEYHTTAYWNGNRNSSWDSIANWDWPDGYDPFRLRFPYDDRYNQRDEVFFNSAGTIAHQITTLGGDRYACGITFGANSTAPITLGAPGDGTLYLGEYGITVQPGAAAHTINSTLGTRWHDQVRNSIFANDSGNVLALNGAIPFADHPFGRGRLFTAGRGEINITDTITVGWLSASGNGTLRLSGNSTLTVDNGFTLSGSFTLILDNSTVNTTRLAAVPILQGGRFGAPTLRFIGKNGEDSSETIGRYWLDGASMTFSLEPAGAQNTVLNIDGGSLYCERGSVGVFQTTGALGGQAQVIVTSCSGGGTGSGNAPANLLDQHMVKDSSGMNFATLDSGTGQITAFANYYTDFSGSSDQVVGLSGGGTHTLSADVSAYALKIVGGTSLSLGTNTLTMSNPLSNPYAVILKSGTGDTAVSGGTITRQYNEGLSFFVEGGTLKIGDTGTGNSTALKRPAVFSSPMHFTKAGPGLLDLTNATLDYDGVDEETDPAPIVINASAGVTRMNPGMITTAPKGSLLVAGGQVELTGDLTISQYSPEVDVTYYDADIPGFVTVEGSTTARGLVTWMAGGFAAYGGDRTAGLSPGYTTPVWGDSSVGIMSGAGGPMVLSSETATGKIKIAHDFDLGTYRGTDGVPQSREIRVPDNTGSTADMAEISGTISGADRRVYTLKTGPGTLIFSGANTYSGDTAIAGGTLKLGASGVIPDGAGKGNVCLSESGTLDLNGYSETINGLSSDSSSIVVDGSSGTPMLTVGNNNATSIFGGFIRNTTGTLSLAKIGAGTLTLSGANTHGGTTTVAAGGLLVNGTLDSPGGTVTVGDTAMLGGSGTISREIIVDSGGSLAPGAGVGTLTVTGAVTLDSDSKLWIEVNGTTADRVTIAGDLTPTAFVQVLPLYAGGASISGPLTILSWTGTGPTDASAFTLDMSQSGDPTKTVVSWDGGGGDNLWGTGANWDLNSLKGGSLAVVGKELQLSSVSVVAIPPMTNSAVVIAPAGSSPVVVGAPTATTVAWLNLGASSGSDTARLNLTDGNLTVTGAVEINPLGVLDIGAGRTLTTALLNVRGQLRVANNSTVTSVNGITIGPASGFGSGEIYVDTANTWTYGGTIANNSASRTPAGTGGLVKTGAGTLTLSGANSYSGATTVSAGTLRVSKISGSNSNIGNPTNAVTLGSDGAQGILSYTGNNATYTRGFIIGGAGGGRLNVTTAGQTLTVGTTGVTGSGLFTVGGDGNTTISTNVTHTGGLTKEDGGTLTLSGDNTYTGGTTVNGGTLLWSGANNLPGAGILAVNAGGTFSLADGTARNTTTPALTLAGGAVLAFDWTGASTGDGLTSTADITPAAGSSIGIVINRSGSPSGSVTLLTGGSGSTLSSANFFLANNANFTATLTATPTTVSIGSYATATALANAYWLGNRVPNALGSMALSSGTMSNWARDANGTPAGGVVPGGAGVNVIFSATGAAQQPNVTTGADMNLKSITFNDSTAVTIGGVNRIALNGTSGSAATTSGALQPVTAGSAISVTEYANANNTIGANLMLGAGQTWNVAGGHTLTVNGVVSGGNSLAIGSSGNAGTVVLSGTSTYAGTTAVNCGTLQVNGTLDPRTSAVTVNSRGTLVGTGTINRPVTVKLDGTLAPGTDGTVGELKVTGTTTFEGGSTFRVDVGGAKADKLVIAGAASIATGAKLAFNKRSALTANEYAIATATSGGLGTAFRCSTVPAGYTLQASATQLSLRKSGGGMLFMLR